MSNDDKSLINVSGDGLTKPATVLVEKISDAIGVLYEPKRITKKAKAEAEAEIIKAKAEIEVGDLRERASKRVLAEEMENQSNIDAVVAEAIENLEDDSKPNDLENSWLRRFFNEAKFASTSEARERYAKILAGEANAPGTFSVRTMITLGVMSKEEADSFTSLTHFCDDNGYCIVLDHTDKVYSNKGLNFETLANLDKIGLITFASTAGLNLSAKQGPIKLVLSFNNHSWIVTPKNSQETIPIGSVLLSPEGKQIQKLSKRTDQSDFIGYLKKKYEGQGYNFEKQQPFSISPLSFTLP